MMRPEKLCAHSLLILILALTGCDMLTPKKGSNPVIESASLTDANCVESDNNIFFAGEAPQIILSLSDDDENIEKIIIDAYLGDELKFEIVEDVRQWKNPEDYTVTLDSLDNDPGDWTVVVTVEDERGLKAETTFDMTVVDIFDEICAIDEVKEIATSFPDEEDSSIVRNKVNIHYSATNPYARTIDMLKFDIFVAFTNGDEMSVNVALTDLTQDTEVSSIREVSYVDTLTYDKAYIDEDSIVVKVY